MNTEGLSSNLNDGFDIRLVALEARLDARISNLVHAVNMLGVRMDERDKLHEERHQAQEKQNAERQGAYDRQFAEHRQEQEKRQREQDRRYEEQRRYFEERDKRLDIYMRRSEKFEESAASMKNRMWLATLSVVLASIGVAVGSYQATQESNLSMSQTILAAFQQGQQTAAIAAQAAAAHAIPTEGKLLRD